MNSSCRPVRFKDLQPYDMKIIQGLHWAEEMYKELEFGFKKSFLAWITEVLILSQNEEDVKDWRQTFIDQFEERCCELVGDIQELHEQVVVNIERYLKKAQHLCKILQIEMPSIGQPKLGLYQEQLEIKKKIHDLKKTLDTRQEELKSLCQKEAKYCRRLGFEPKSLPENSIPTMEVIMELQKHIEELEHEVFEREEKFCIIKEELLQTIEELEYIPNTQFEKDVIYGDLPLSVNNTNMKALEDFQKRIQNERTKVIDEISELSMKIEQAWSLLDFDFSKREEFRNKYTRNSLKTLNALREEFARCNELKKAHLKVFVEKIRRELVKVWGECLCSDEIRNEFIYFDSDCYTNDLLELHEGQLNKWRSYADQNKEILSLLVKYKELWYRMIELEQNAEGPDRFNNRGGKLLKEEKERNQLVKKIPKIEKTLLHMAASYEAQHREEILIFGKTVGQYIENLHADKEEAKVQKLSARKAQREATIMTPSKCYPNAASRLFTSTSTAAKHPKGAVTSIKKPNKPASRRVLTDPRRRSKGMITKLFDRTMTTKDSPRNKSQIGKKRENVKKQLINETYLEFENDMSQRIGARSTINFFDEDLNSPTLGAPLPATPGIRGRNLPNRCPMITVTAFESSRTPVQRSKRLNL